MSMTNRHNIDKDMWSQLTMCNQLRINSRTNTHDAHKDAVLFLKRQEIKSIVNTLGPTELSQVALLGTKDPKASLQLATQLATAALLNPVREPCPLQIEVLRAHSPSKTEEELKSFITAQGQRDWEAYYKQRVQDNISLADIEKEWLDLETAQYKRRKRYESLHQAMYTRNLSFSKNKNASKVLKKLMARVQNK